MSKATRQLDIDDVVMLEIDGTRVPCKVVRQPQRIVVPPGAMTFWVMERETNDLHMVSARPEYVFELETEQGEQDAGTAL